MSPRQIALSLAAFAAVVGCANAPPSTPTAAPSQARTAVVSGSRVPQPVDAAGRPVAADPRLRSYSGDDLQNGRTDLANALSAIDPLIQASEPH